MKKICAMFAATVAVLLAPAGAKADDFSTWSRRMAVGLNYTGNETLANFPVLVKLPAAATREMREGGADLRFATTALDGLDFEIDAWDTNGVSKVWVKIPELAPGATGIFVFWGNAGALPAGNPAATWSEGYVGVWHMNESGAAPLNSVPDSSPNANDMAEAGGAVTFSQNGVVGKAAGYANAAINDHMRAAHNTSMDVGAELTVEAWTHDISASGNVQARGIVSKRTDTGTARSFSLMRGDGGNSRLRFDIGSVVFDLGATTTRNDWMYVAVTFDGAIATTTARVKCFTNGELAATPATAAPAAIPAGNANMHIGTLNQGYGQGWHGYLDEIRVSNTARSAAWLKACYDTIVSDAFAVCGAPGDNTGDGLIFTTGAAANIRHDGADFSGAFISSDDVSNFGVYLYWGVDDGGEDPAAWTGARVAANVSGHAYSASLAGLQPGATYFARYAAETNSTLYWSVNTVSFETLPAPVPILGGVSVFSTPTNGTTLSVDVLRAGHDSTLSLSWKPAGESVWTPAAPIANPAAGANTFSLPGTQNHATYDYALTLANDFGAAATSGTFRVNYIYNWVAGSANRPWGNPSNWDVGIAPDGAGDIVILPNAAFSTDFSAMQSVTLGGLTFDKLGNYNNITILSTNGAPLVFDNGASPARIVVTSSNWGQPSFRAPTRLDSETRAHITRSENNQALNFVGDISGGGTLLLEAGVIGLCASAGDTSRVSATLGYVLNGVTKFYRKRGAGDVVLEGGVHVIPLAAGWNSYTDAPVGDGGRFIISGSIVTNIYVADRSSFFADSGNAFIVSNNASVVYEGNTDMYFQRSGNTIEVTGAGSALQLPRFSMNAMNNTFRVADGGTVRLLRDDFRLQGGTNLFTIGSAAPAPSVLDLFGKTFIITETEPTFVCAPGGIVTNGNITLGSATTLNARFVLRGGEVYCNTFSANANQSIAPVLSPDGVKPIIANTAVFAAGSKIAPETEDGFAPGVYPIITAKTLSGFENITLEAPGKYLWKLDQITEPDTRQTIRLSCRLLSTVLIVM